MKGAATSAFIIMAFLGAVVGAGLAGFGIYRASRRAGNAVSGVGHQAEETLQVIRSEAVRIRKFLIEDAWPEVNKTITHFNKVLDDVETFLVIGTFTTKIFALLLAVCVLYMCKSIIQKNERRKNHNPNLFLLVEEISLYFISTLCLVMAVVLVLHILVEFFDISLPNMRIPFIIIIPSVTTVLLVLHYIKQLVSAVIALCIFMLHITLWLPFHFFTDPVNRGSAYRHTFHLLIVPFFIPFAALYFASIYFSFFVWLEIFEKSVKGKKENHESGFTLLETIFISYVIFYIAAILTNIFGSILIASFIRPLWAYFAMRNLNN